MARLLMTVLAVLVFLAACGADGTVGMPVASAWTDIGLLEWLG